MWVVLFLGCLAGLSPRAVAGESPAAAADRLVGNVYGRVRDAESGLPITGAEIGLFGLTEGESSVLPGPASRERLAMPDPDRAERRGVTDARGDFLINFVPTPFPYRDYLILVRAAGYPALVIDGARVLPGAAMALRLDGQLRRGGGAARWYRGTDPAAPLSYRHEENGVPAGPGRRGGITAMSAGQTVFATREGLVGATTANGHVIVPHDHFVALPSRRALNANDTTLTYQVELTFADKTVVAPVWDVGPWNTKDDYWNPPSIREMWADLATGLPEAQAAFQDGYNAGKNDRGSNVVNAAGIDLADGTYQDDLALKDNSWIQVKFLWLPGNVGDRVRVKADALNVRDQPGGAALYQENQGALGTLLRGPEGAKLGSTFYLWWQVQWDDAATPGWSAEMYLEKAPVAPAELRLTIRRVAGAPELTIQGQTGASVGIQTSPSLGATNLWTTLTQVTLASPVLTWTDTAASDDGCARFYRAVLGP